MKKIKWKLVVVVLLFFTVLGTVGLTASAASSDSPINTDRIEIDYKKETITITIADTNKMLDDLGDNIVYFTTTYTKDVSRWDACEVREFEEGGTTVKKAVFDISWIVANKTVRLYICGDVNTKVVNADIVWEENFGVRYVGTLLNTDITEAETWKKIYHGDLTDPTDGYPYFSEDTGYFIFTITREGRKESYFDLDTIQWRKGNDGMWRSFNELDLKEMNIRGIGLEFRIVANNPDPDNEKAGARASSVAKIAITKLASAPLVTVNPDMMTVSIKNGMEFSFDKENWILVPTYSNKFGTDDYLVNQKERENAIETIYTRERRATLMMQEIMQEHLKVVKNNPDYVFKSNTPMNRGFLEAEYKDDGFTFKEEGIVLYVRTIGSERKAASKIAQVFIPYASDDKAEETHITFSYGESKTNTGGIVVENESDFRYQVGVITPEDKEYAKFEKGEEDNLDLSNVKWTSVKEGKMTKISNKKVPENSYLIYRIAGDNGNLPSTYLFYGPMKYDHITYAGIANATVAVGQTLTAVPGTNFKLDAEASDVTYKDKYGEGLSYRWQSSDNKLAEDEEWTDLSSTDATLELTDAMETKYIRVIIKDQYENEKVSTPVGPVKAAPKQTNP